MNKQITLSVFFILLATTVQAEVPPGTFTSEREKISYLYGMDIGKNLKNIPDEFDLAALSRGLNDSYQGKATLIPDADVGAIRTSYQKTLREKMDAQRKEQGVKNKAEGAKFLESNKAKPGVKVTSSGLQYRAIKEGTGAQIKEGDRVKLQYRGKLIDGTQFDSSYDRNGPLVLPVTGMIKGWTEGLQLMKVGSTYELVMPSELGYGDRGAGKQIGPEAVLVFEVEAIGIEEAKEPAAAAMPIPNQQKPAVKVVPKP